MYVSSDRSYSYAAASENESFANEIKQQNEVADGEIM